MRKALRTAPPKALHRAERCLHRGFRNWNVAIIRARGFADRRRGIGERAVNLPERALGRRHAVVHPKLVADTVKFRAKARRLRARCRRFLHRVVPRPARLLGAPAGLRECRGVLRRDRRARVDAMARLKLCQRRGEEAHALVRDARLLFRARASRELRRARLALAHLCLAPGVERLGAGSLGARCGARCSGTPLVHALH